MDLNKSSEFNLSSPLVQNYTSSYSFMLPSHHQTKEEWEETKRSHLMQAKNQNLQFFWNQQLFDIQNLSVFKSHQLPLARIKRIVKSNKEVKMISADTPVLLAKACELLIMELTLRSWLQTEGSQRRTLQRCDIGRAITFYPTLHFLLPAVPCHHHSMDNENEKVDAETEVLPHVQTPFPIIDINKDFVLPTSEIPQQFTMGPSPMSSKKVN